MDNRKITQAMILAAGEGKRLRPLTLTTPKPLISLGGIPLLHRVINRLTAAGMESIVINTHYLGDQIKEFVEELIHTRSFPGIKLSPEPESLETGGGIAFARPLYDDGPLITVNSDIWWKENNGEPDILSQLHIHWDQSKMDALLVLVSRDNVLYYEGPGDFNMSANGQLTPRGESPYAEYIYTGIQIILPERVVMGKKGKFPLFECYKELSSHNRLYGIELPGKWCDVGTIQALEGMESLIKSQTINNHINY